MQREFGSAYNWCDRCCERCPLAPDCPAHRQSESRRLALVSRGEDPDDLGTVLLDLEAALSESLAMLVAHTVEKGIPCEDLDEPPPPPAEEAVALRAHALAYVVAIDQLAGCLPREMLSAGQYAVRQALSGAGLIYAKITRISDQPGGDATADDEVPWWEDTVPNLLLIEHVMAQVDLAVETLQRRLVRAGNAAAEASRDLRKALEPLLRAVPEEARQELALLRVGARAPSPFCVLFPRTYRLRASTVLS